MAFLPVLHRSRLARSSAPDSSALRNARIWPTSSVSCSHCAFSFASDCSSCRQLLFDRGQTVGVIFADRRFAFQNLLLDLQIVDAARRIFDRAAAWCSARAQAARRRCRARSPPCPAAAVRPDSDATSRTVARNGLIENAQLVMFLQCRYDAAQHRRRMRLRSALPPSPPGSAAPGPHLSRRYFLYSDHVVAAMVRSSPRARAGFSRLAASFCPAWPPAPIMVCASSMNRMIGCGDDFTSLISPLSRFSNSPLTPAPACNNARSRL